MEPLAGDDPRTIGEYRLLRRLGAGGMGRVYLGRSPGGRTVAVKVVHPHFAADDQFRSRFRREIAAARRVGGAWTAPVLDADPDAATPWVATGYVAGPSLHDAVAAHGPLPERSVRAAVAGLAEALDAVHRLGLVHRDVKPSNVLLTLDGPRLIDFGIARATDATASLTGTGVSIGSPGFMSPEQVLGREAATASDVFSLGAVLVFAATGQGPFPGESSATLLYKVVHEEPELGALDGELRELATACLAKEPAARPGVADVVRRLGGEGGAAGLIGPGWLPGPVVEGASRRAVQLLEPETEPPPAAGPPRTGSSAPPPASSPIGAFGPAAWDQPTADNPHTPPPAHAPTAPGAAHQPHNPHTPWSPPSAAPAPAGGPPPGAARSRRNRALVIVLAVVAVVALGLGVYAVSRLGAEGRDNPGATGGPVGPSEDPTGSTDDRPSTSSTDSGELDAIPDAFLGTWEGSYPAMLSRRPTTVVAHISRGGPGDQAVRFTVSLEGTTCKSVASVAGVTDRVLRLTDELDDEEYTNPIGCIASPGEIVLTRDGDKLHYRVQDPLAGTITAKLTRRG
ncbi:serine/threonine protein kinase [Streptomyces durbertensis]|uniref:Serine/threonine protein kinase n=1 Tax=Streptomyces durbertensis TaxID=2448886 RepID=A0ABR6EFW9_9ACTN|nr:serine/threonine-protein kinase [Streptomyces durbertensis]MBB1244235.1 serine/threonine protein kinase [Streptomyces durbertensis]